MERVITDDMLAMARDFSIGMTRVERSAIFNDKMIEDKAMNTRYSDGRTVKEAIDAMLKAGGVPSFKKGDTIGRNYAKMVCRRLI